MGIEDVDLLEEDDDIIIVEPRPSANNSWRTTSTTRRPKRTTKEYGGPTSQPSYLTKNLSKERFGSWTVDPVKCIKPVVVSNTIDVHSGQNHHRQNVTTNVAFKRDQGRREHIPRLPARLGLPSESLFVLNTRSSEQPHTSLSTTEFGKSSVSALPPLVTKEPPHDDDQRNSIRMAQRALAKRLASSAVPMTDPLAIPSILFRIELASHGHLSYNQAYRKPHIPFNRSIPKVQRNPSWAENGDIRALATRFACEDFVAAIWGRDLNPKIRGSSNLHTASSIASQCIRPVTVQGVNMFLLGMEFPLRYVLLIGYVMGVTVYEDHTVYFVDDSTAVTECVCSTPLDGRRRDRHRTDTAEPAASVPTKEAVESMKDDGDPVKFKVGTLVRAVGKIGEGYRPDSDKTIIVDKLESLRDANMEVRHHLLVARLHKEVYNQPVDLKARLHSIFKKEQSQVRETDNSSQATSDANGSPTKPKKVKLPNPRSLEPQDLTLDNFGVYIKSYLRRHHLRVLNGLGQDLPSPGSHSVSISHAPWNTVESENLLPEEEPLPFSLSQLERNRTLKKFAELMVQQEIIDRLRSSKYKRRAAKSALDTIHMTKKVMTVWNNPARPSIEGLRTTAYLGERGGSATLLPPPRRHAVNNGKLSDQGLNSCGSSSSLLDSQDIPIFEDVSLRRKTEIGESFRVQGSALAKASRSCFLRALRSLRESGEIILAEEQENVDQSHSSPASPHRQTGLSERDIQQNRNSAKKVSSENGMCPWPLLIYEDESLGRQSRPKTRGEQAGVSHGAAPWPIIGFDETKEEGTAVQDHVIDVNVTPKKIKGEDFLTPKQVSVKKNHLEHEKFELVTLKCLGSQIIRLVEEEKIRSDTVGQSTYGLNLTKIAKCLRQDTRWAAVAQNLDMLEKAAEEAVTRRRIMKMGKFYCSEKYAKPGND